MNRSIIEHVAIWKVTNKKSNTDAANVLGISRGAFEARLGGKVEWKFPSEIMAICKLCGCSVDQLLGIKQ